MDCSYSRINSNDSKVLSDLPEELVLAIFSYLPQRSLARTAQVSKMFKRISYDASLWKRVCFQNKKLDPFTLGCVLSRGTKWLGIDNCKFLEPFCLDEPRGCMLSHLTFAQCHGHLPERDYRCLLWILTCCEHLKSLALTAELVMLGEEFYCTLSEARNLEVLNFTSDLSFPGVLRIARGCQRLRSWIYIGREIKMTGSEIDSVINDLAASIETIYIFKFNRSMTNKHIAALVKRCPNITHLHLQSCTELTSKAIRHLCTLEKLKYLNISRCHEISSNSLCQLKQVKSLEWLVAFNIINSSKEVEMLQRTLAPVVVDVFSLPMTNDDYDD